LVRGDNVGYIYTDAGHTNPLRRIKHLELVSREEDNDRKKYRDMLLSVDAKLQKRCLVILALTGYVKVTAQGKGSSAEKPAAAANGSCLAEQVKGSAGICSKESEAKACPTCAPGSAAAAEKSSTDR
jgi:hypothetical protein